MKIGRREVGPGHPVFIIAECGSNHGGSLDRALALIDAAADAGADCAKFQRFRVDHFLVPRENPEALRRYELPDDWLPVLKSKCQSRDLEFLCTAFDLESLAVIDPWVDAHKIGSAETPREFYCDAVARKGKPIIFSTGQTSTWRAKLYSQDTIALACVSKYPAPVAGYLRVYPGGYAGWGVSDHTLHPTIVPAAATALGACVIEKHVGFSNFETPDSIVSIGFLQFAAMVEAVRLTEKAVRG